MTDQQLKTEDEFARPAFLDMMKAKVSEVDHVANSCSMTLELGREFCHSIDIVQGGFVTAMLDAAMSHSVFTCNPDVISVATLEIKVSFFEPSRAGRFRCRGVLRKCGRSTGFMDGELFDESGLLLATATTTAKLIRAKPKSG